MSDIVTQYAQDLLIECGWSLADLDDKLGRATIRIWADSCGRPGDCLASLKTSFRVAREAARLISEHNRQEIQARFADSFSKPNKW